MAGCYSFQEHSRGSKGCWPPRLAFRACPLRLIPRDNPPHQAGRPNCWAPRRVSPADIAPSRRAQEGRGRATAVPLVQSPPPERASATPVIPFLRYVQYARRGGCRWVRDKLNHSIQERDPCGVQMQIDQPGSREATVVFETGLPGNVTRRGTMVRSLCEGRTPPWIRRAL